MDGVTLGKGNFAHVELATHGVINLKVESCTVLSYLNYAIL